MDSLSLNASEYLAMTARLGFTTTPEVRIGPGPPYTTPSLQVNLFFRVFLGILGVAITATPARLLWRSGEFAATVFCVISMVLNTIYVVNALIWRDNNVAEWWAGDGWCDVQTYVYFPLNMAFHAALFEIMRGLTAKVALQRVTSLTPRERRRQGVVSAAVIFACPLLQVALTFLVILVRYNVSPLIGCTAFYDPDWVFLVFFVLPPVFVTIGASALAGEFSCLSVLCFLIRALADWMVVWQS